MLDRRSIGDLDMLHRNPMWLIGDQSKFDMPIGDRKARLKTIWDRNVPLETDLPYRTPTCTIGDRNACKNPLKTNMLAESNRNFETYVFKYIHVFLYTFCLFIYISVSNGSSIRHVSLQWGMSVLYGSLIRHIGLRWVSDKSPMGLR